MESVALNRFLAAGGVCSRRKAVDLIREGCVTVNRVVCVEPGYRVHSEDIIRCNELLVKPTRFVYVLLNKPVGVVATCSDEFGRPTVLSLCAGAVKRGVRLYPVGRLDTDSTGLMILTNDGEWMQATVHPRAEVTKRYRVKLHEPVTSEYLTQLHKGVYLRDGYARIDRAYIKSRDRRTIEVWLHSGKNRIIRRLFAHGGFHVKALQRTHYGSLCDATLKRGMWRYLTDAEIRFVRLSQESP